MEKKEFILISTAISGLNQDKDQMFKLLQNPEMRECCNSSFGNNFFPVIGIDSKGTVKCYCEEDDITDDLAILVIPDNKTIENGILEFTESMLGKCDMLYILLHNGQGSLHGTHQNQILQLAQNNLPKIRVAKCHHTQSSSMNPEHALGDGLEMVAKAVLAKTINIEAYKAGLDYLMSKPNYYSPVLESLIRLHKTLSISQISNPELTIGILKSQDKYNLAFELLNKENGNRKIEDVLKWTSSIIPELSKS